MDFSKKVVLITGAARGIGKTVAETFLQYDATVILNDVNEDSLIETKNEFSSQKGKCDTVVADTSKPDEVERMYADIANKYGRLDVLVNNAGITRDGFLHKLSLEQWQKVIDVNLTGVFLCLQGAARMMKAQNSGRIVNISSAAWNGNMGQANYSASKAGVVGLTRTAAKELARANILVNAIAPGIIDTDMIKTVPDDVLKTLLKSVPLGRPGKTAELANLVLFLSSDLCTYITGQTINIDGGWFMS